MVILIVTIGSALALVPRVGKPMRLGIDLRGGAELLFRIDTTGLDESQKSGITDKTVDIVRERIDPLDQKGLIIQSRDQQRILMQLPGFSRDATKDIIALATNLGRLEMRLVAREQERDKIAFLQSGRSLPGYAYYPYAKTMKELAAKELGEDGLLVRTNDGYEVTGELLSRVYPSMDQAGAPAVSFQFRTEGAKRFARMTGEHIGERIAIILNGEVYSAPSVKSQISTSGIIEGIRDQKEVDMLVKILNSGSLKAPLVLESEQYVGPSLGENTIAAGVRAGIVGALISLVFIAGYYFFAGLVADFALVLNLVMLMAFMVVSQATLTLPGIAGVFLTIGMAVDANVLINERFREERRLGREISQALRMGYDKAFSAIFDSNLTTFATGVILYIYGTGPVKGFAVTLSVGIAISFFTAVFVTRVIFELSIKYGFVSDLKMIHLFTRTNVKFLEACRYALLVSLVVVAAGFYVFVAQGKGNLDIDFTGGSMAQLQLTSPMDIDEVRQRIAKTGYPDATVQAVAAEKTQVGAEQDVRGSEGAKGFLGKSTTFAVRTQLQEKTDIATFETAIGREFADSVNYRAIGVTKRSVTEVKGRNDPYFGGIRCEAELAEPVSAVKMKADIEKLGLANPEIKYYKVDASGGLVELPVDAPSVSVFAARVTGIQESLLVEKLSKAFTVPNPFLEQVSYVGKQVAQEMEGKATLAILLSLGFTIVYIWFRFGRLSYGLAAVIALTFDVMFTLGAMAVGDLLGATAFGQALLLGNFKINLPVIAALLTIVGYSVNDKIVVFDRIRENMRLKTKSDWDVINGSINQTLSRTVLTGTTTIVMLLVMYIMGGPGLHAFAYVMLVGVLIGTYSSLFVACPMLVLGEVIKGKPLNTGRSK